MAFNYPWYSIYHQKFKDKTTKESEKAHYFQFKNSAILFCGCLIYTILTFPVLMLYHNGASKQTFEKIITYFQTLPENPFYFINMLIKWTKYVYASQDYTWINFLPFLAPIFFAFGYYKILEANPFDWNWRGGGPARWAEFREFKKWGLIGGTKLIIGKFAKNILRTSTLENIVVIGNSGIGKTVSISMPNILANDKMSFFIHDEMGRLWPKTAGYRSTLGPVFNMNFASIDDPKNGVYWPRWNPISLNMVPPPGADRQLYLDDFIGLFMPNGPEGTDPYWMKTARDAFHGFVDYLLCKVAQAQANDYFLSRLYEDDLDDEDYEVLESYYITMQGDNVKDALELTKNKAITLDNFLPIGSWEGIPSIWQGRDVCVPMFLDWFTMQRLNMITFAQELKESGDPKSHQFDVIFEILSAAVNESYFFGYSRRALVELNQLKNVPQNQRGSIISVINAALGAFKNEAVRQRTCSNDFPPFVLRGWQDPQTLEWKPATIYFSGDAYSGFTSILCGLFFDFTVAFNMGKKPTKGLPDDKTGPFQVMLIMEDFFWTVSSAMLLIAMRNITTKEMGALVIAQNFDKMKEKMDDIVNICRVRIIMRINNEETVARINGWFETRTYLNPPEGFADHFLWFPTGFFKTKFAKRNVKVTGKSSPSKPFTPGPTMLTLPVNKEIVYFHGNSEFPIRCDKYRYYENPKLVEKSNFPEPNFMLEHFINSRKEEDKENPKSLWQSLDAATKKRLGIIDYSDLDEIEAAEKEDKKQKTQYTPDLSDFDEKKQVTNDDDIKPKKIEDEKIKKEKDAILKEKFPLFKKESKRPAIKNIPT